MSKLLKLALIIIVLLACAWLYLESDPARPTPSTGVNVPAFIGKPATANPVPMTRPYKQHPFLAPAGVNSMHNDARQSDAYPWAGPLGHRPQRVADLVVRPFDDRELRPPLQQWVFHRAPD